MESFDLNVFSSIRKPLIGPIKDFTLDNGSSIRTQPGQKSQGVLTHQLPNQTQSQSLVPIHDVIAGNVD